MPYCKNCGTQVAEDYMYCPNFGATVRGPSKSMLVVAGWGERFVAWIIDMIVLGFFFSQSESSFHYLSCQIFGC